MKLSNVFFIVVIIYMIFDTVYSFNFSEGSKQRGANIIERQINIEAALHRIENNQLLVIKGLAK